MHDIDYSDVSPDPALAAVLRRSTPTAAEPVTVTLTLTPSPNPDPNPHQVLGRLAVPAWIFTARCAPLQPTYYHPRVAH